MRKVNTLNDYIKTTLSLMAAGIAGAGLGKLLKEVLFQEVSLEYPVIWNMASTYIKNNSFLLYQSSKNYCFEWSTRPVEYPKIVFEKFPESFSIHLLYGFIPIAMMFTRAESTSYISIKLLLPRFFMDSNKFIKKIIEYDKKHYTKSTTDKIVVCNGTMNPGDYNYRTLEKAEDNFMDRHSKDTVIYQPDDVPIIKKPIYLSDDNKLFYEDIKKWIDDKDWYNERGLSWRRGALLYGSSGNGKTTIVRHAAEMLDIPIRIFDLSSLDSVGFSQAWSNRDVGHKFIYLIEDIDSVFNGRTNVVVGQKQGVDFSCFLNTICGVSKSDGIYLVITTNNPEILDSALCGWKDNRPIPRPGRVDRAFCFKNITPDGMKYLSSMILYDKKSHADELMEKFSGEDISHAQFLEECITRALGLKENK